MNSCREISKYQRYMSLIGLMPYSGNRQQQMRQKICIVLLLLGILGFSIYGLATTDMHNKEDLMISSSVSAMVFIAQITALIIAQCEMLATYERYLEFNRCLHAVYEKIHHKMGHKICSGAFGAYLRRKYGYISFFAGSSVVAFGVLALLYYTYGYFWYSLPAVIILRIRFLQVSVYIDIISNYLNQLNRDFEHIVKLKRSRELPFNNRIERSEVESLQYLMILKEIYNDLVHIVSLFNEIFGWSLVGFIVCTFMGITFNLYWSILSLDGFYRPHIFYCSFCTLFSLMLLWCVFCYNCEKFRKSFFQTKSLVKSLIQDPNANYNALLHEFLLQLTNCSLLISAKGFFNGDMQLLMALFTSIGSVMVILVQFSSAEFDRYNNE